MENKELKDLMETVYNEMSKGLVEVTEDISNLKEDLKDNPKLFKELTKKLNKLEKVRKNFQSQLQDLKEKINNLFTEEEWV